MFIMNALNLQRLLNQVEREESKAFKTYCNVPAIENCIEHHAWHAIKTNLLILKKLS